jgi:diguanylate cyclase (GGDEF)-like protein
MVSSTLVTPFSAARAATVKLAASAAGVGYPRRSGRGGTKHVRTVSSLLLPAGLLGLAAVALNYPPPQPAQLTSFLRVFPWVVLVVGVLLALRFRRGRVVLALLTLAAADRVLLRFPTGTTGEAARFAFNATALALPLDLAWLAIARERGTFTPHGFLRACAIAAQPALAVFLWLSYQPHLVRLLERPFLPRVVAPATSLAHAALLAFAAALVAVGVTWVRRRTTLEAGFLWALVASLVALNAPARSTTTYLAAGGLILVVSVVEATFAMAYRDAMTGLPSRRAFDEALAKLGGRYAIAIIDIDRFKGINDTHGHHVGDQVLRMVATRLAGVASARAFRIGGEEFALLFPSKPRSEARPLLEGLRTGIAEAGFTLRGEDRPSKRPKEVEPREGQPVRIRVTVSIGVAERVGVLDAPGDVLKAADKALYRAKRGGRNRVAP